MKEKPKTNYVVLGGLVAVVFVVVVVKMFVPSVPVRAREAARRAQCVDNLKQIEAAMHSYHDEYGQFPPAYTVDEAEKPLHSWRTLLLPFFEKKDLYGKIKLDEPWDSPGNLAVYEDFMIGVYQCPSFPEGEGYVTRTNYVMVTGPKCVSDGPHSRSLGDLPEKGSKTIHVIETTVPIRWYEPKDLKAEAIVVKMNDQESPAIGSDHPGIVLAAFCDGHVESLSCGTDPKELRAMFELEEEPSWKSSFEALHEKVSE